jgi:hypothetical protein
MQAKEKRFTRASVQRAMRVPGVIAGVIIVAIMACYFYWVRDQNAYFVGRDLRMLATLTSQLEAAITTHQKFVRNYAEGFRRSAPGQPARNPPPDTIRRYNANDQVQIDNYAPDFDSITRKDCRSLLGRAGADASATNASATDLKSRLQQTPNGELIRSELTEVGGVLTLRIDFAEVVPPEGELVPPGGTATGVLEACGELPLSRLTRPLFSRELLSAFDTVVLANGAGKVLYSVQPPHVASTLLTSVLAPAEAEGDRQPLAPGIIAGSLGSFFEHGFLGDKVALDVRKLPDATRQQTVQLSGANFRLFTQPCDFPVPPLVQDGKVAPADQRWIIGGLISESRFRYETFAISPSMIFFVCGLLILAICCWPFLRVALIGEHQALTIGDVVLTGVCAVVGASILTLILLDYLEYQRLGAGADQQLRDYGAQLERDFSHDLFRARRALEAIHGWDLVGPRLETADLEDISSSDSPGPVPDASRPGADRTEAIAKRTSLLGLSAVKQYPYFSFFAWVSAKGDQIRKGSMRGKTTSPNVAAREYFRAALRDEWWYVRPPQDPFGSCTPDKPDNGGALSEPCTSKAAAALSQPCIPKKVGALVEPCLPANVSPAPLERLPYILASVRSLTSGKAEAVIAMPLPENQETPILTLTCQLIHLYAAVPPPGVEFAIIDEQGHVVFHSDPERNDQENFFVETDNSRRLRAAVLARRAALVEARYWGEENTIYARPLMNSGLTLLTFRSHRLLQAANAESVLMTVLCLLFNSSPYLLVLLALVLLAPAYRAPWLWPNRRYEAQYRHLAEVFVATIATTLVSTQFLEPPLLLYVIFAAPLKGIVSAYLVMAKRRTTTWWVLFGTWWAAVASIAFGMTAARLDAGLDNHSRSFVFLLYLLLMTDVVVSLREILRFDFGDDVPLADKGLHGPAPEPAETAQRGGEETGAASPPPLKEPAARVTARVGAALTAFMDRLRVAWAGGLTAGAGLTPSEPPWLLRYPGIYYASGALLLVVAAVLPTVGFFKLGGRLEQETLIKYSQLRLASSIEDRLNRVGELAFETPDEHAVRADMTYFEAPPMWDTGWRLRPMPIAAGEHFPLPPHAAAGRSERLVPEVLSSFVPHYSDDAVAMRQLYSSGSADKIWRWHRDGAYLVLDRLVRLTNLRKSHTAQLYGPCPPPPPCPPQTRCPAQVPCPPPATWPPGVPWPPQHEHLTIWSVVPPLLTTIFTAAPKVDPGRNQTGQGQVDRFGVADLLYTILCLTLLSGFLGVLAWMTHFVATRVLLIDVAEPLWLRNLPISPTLGDHIFLVRRERTLQSVIGIQNPEGFHTVSFQKLATSDSWIRELIEIDEGESGRNVCVTDFEYEIDVPGMNSRKLAWLEKLMALPDRTVLVVSTVTPLFITIVPESVPPSSSTFDGPVGSAQEALSPAHSDRERWQSLLGSFVVVTGEQLDLAQTSNSALMRPLRQNGSARSVRLAKWLWEETRHDPFLRKLAYELDCNSERAQLVDELRERADTYFAGLWRSCSSDEKVLLFQLAKSGLVNATNRRIIRRLMARGLVRREPNFKLFSATFRLYVLSAGRREDVVQVAREEHPRSQWDSLRVPLFVVIGTLLLLMFATQKDLLSATTALATVLTTGLPVLVKLIGMFTEHRLETNDRPM